MSVAARTRASLWILTFSLFTLAVVIVWWAWDDVTVYSNSVYTRPGDGQYDEFSIHIPPNAPQPIRVLLALHGFGESGQKEREALRQTADADGLVLIAPTFHYKAIDDAAVLAGEDVENFARIVSFLDRLPAIAGAPMQSQILLYGFSRGGQTAHRFALVYPERVAATAVLSAGAYTLPLASLGDGGPTLAFPFGIANLGEVTGRPFSPADFAR